MADSKNVSWAWSAHLQPTRAEDPALFDSVADI